MIQLHSPITLLHILNALKAISFRLQSLILQEHIGPIPFHQLLERFRTTLLPTLDIKHSFVLHGGAQPVANLILNLGLSELIVVIGYHFYLIVSTPPGYSRHPVVQVLTFVCILLTFMDYPVGMLGKGGVRPVSHHRRWISAMHLRWRVVSWLMAPGCRHILAVFFNVLQRGVN